MNAIAIAIVIQTLILAGALAFAVRWLGQKLGDIKTSVDYQSYMVNELINTLSSLVGGIVALTTPTKSKGNNKIEEVRK